MVNETSPTGAFGEDAAVPGLATIGYEKATLLAVRSALRADGVALVVDVRAVAASRRAGFSKTLLSASLQEEGVGYLHLRALGTPKEGRIAARAGRTLEMREIFTQHLRTETAQAALEEAARLAGTRRICLLCYEADAQCCHRAVLADLISARLQLPVTHLTPGPEFPV